MKLNIALDIKTVRALAALNIEGMQQEVDNYNKAFHRWTSNIDRVMGSVEYINSVFKEPTREREFIDNLELIIKEIKPLFSEEQRKYIWADIEENRLEDLIGMKHRCEALIDKSFLPYHKNYLKYLEDSLIKILIAFNEVHRPNEVIEG